MSSSPGLTALKPIPACWTELGPRPFFGINLVTGRTDEMMSGQVSSIAVDWINDSSGNTVYIGSSSGGLWRSRNGLDLDPRCELLSDQNRSLSVGSVALDSRTKPPIIYVGTGASDNSANVSSYTGIGILISHDDGRTWKQVDSADNGVHPFVGQGFLQHPGGPCGAEYPVGRNRAGNGSKLSAQLDSARRSRIRACRHL